MTLYHSGHLFGVFSTLNPDAIRSVDVYKSGFPVRFGERAGAVFDIESFPVHGSEDATPPRVRVRIGPLSSSLAVRGALTQSLDGSLSARGGMTDLWPGPLESALLNVTRPTATPQSLDSRGFRFADINASLRWRSADGSQVTLTGFAAGDRFEQRLGEDREGGVESYDELKKGAASASGSVRWSRTWAGGLRTTTTLSTSLYSNRVNNELEEELEEELEGVGGESFAELRNDLEEYAARFEADVPLGAAHAIRFGIGATRLDVDLRRLAGEDEHEVDDAPATGASNSGAATTETLPSAFVQDTWTLSPAVSLDLGLRSTWSEGQRRWSHGPRAAVRWAFHPAWSVTATGGRFHQWVAQAVEETLFDAPISAWVITPEGTSSLHGSLDVAYRGSTMEVAASGYVRESDRIGDFAEPGATRSPLLTFDGAGSAWGVEGSLGGSWGPLQSRLGYTYSRVWYTFASVDAGARFPATHDRPHALKLVADLRSGDWEFGLLMLGQSGRPTTPVVGFVSSPDANAPRLIDGARNSERLPAYWRVDLSARHQGRIGRVRWTTTLGLYNVLGRSNAWYREVSVVDSELRREVVPMLGFLPSLTFRLDWP
jgi:hypothetical protein